MIDNYEIALTVIIPLLGAFAQIPLKRKVLKEAVLLITVLLTFLSVFLFMEPVLNGVNFKCDLITFYKGISFKFQVDWLGIFTALILSFAFIIVTIYSLASSRLTMIKKNSAFLFCYLLVEFGIMGVVFSGSLLTLYFFFGVLSVVSWPFSAFHNTEQGLRKSKRYMGLLMIFFKGCFLPAIILVYINCNNIDFSMTNIQYGILKEGSRYLYITIYVLCLLGVANTSILPVNNWLTGVVSKNVTVNIILDILIPVTGVFSIIRIFFSVFGFEVVTATGIDSITITIVLCSMFFSSVLSFYKADLFKRFSYLFISQYACILIGITVFSEYAVIGSVLQLVIFVLSAVTLFIILDIVRLSGYRSGKYILAAFLINGLCFSGVPLFSGFLAKAYLIKATFDNQQELITVFILLGIALSTISVIKVFADNLREGEPLIINGENKRPYLLVGIAYVSVLITYISAVLHNYIISYIDKVVIP